MKHFQITEITERVKTIPFVSYDELKRVIQDDSSRNEVARRHNVSFSRGGQSTEVSIVPVSATPRDFRKYPESNVNYVWILRQIGVFDTEADLKMRNITVEKYVQEILDRKYFKHETSPFPLLSSVDEYGVTFFAYSQKEQLLDELMNLLDVIVDVGVRSDIAELTRFILPLSSNQKVAFWGD